MGHFWPIFPILWAKKTFPVNPSHGILAPRQNVEQINATILRKRPDGRMEGQTEGHKDGWTDPIS